MTMDIVAIQHKTFYSVPGISVRPARNRMRAADRRRAKMRLVSYYGNICFYCAVTLCESSGNTLPDDAGTLDHVLPYGHGGTNRLNNLVLSCNKCNNSRGTKKFTRFMASVHAELNSSELEIAQENYRKYVFLCEQASTCDDYSRFAHDFFAQLSSEVLR